ncbi:protein NUCLEAR FUSION DEFECTIVE 4-like [Quillaja saponaria]|uniref:Protein NUCLEAR FUSION DEFECTIVE 4-like n=1 Tax=Quillaja saponaria TaxID=32244 RepID=A0AAD7PWJ6_QUISA|nr:protein NUCLEAR FUSION DEFECTIVE 4-like [Quillaja saponaria]
MSGNGRGGGLGLDGIKSFTLQVINGRWFMLLSSFLVLSVSGASYMFGLYSREIKSVLGYDQTTLNLLSFFKDLGSNIGILYGLINEVTPPCVVLSIGGALNFFGYFMVWLAVTKKIAKSQIWSMCLYIFIGANSHCSINTGAIVTSVNNFPGILRGVVIGLLTGYLGLSGAIITQLYYAFYGNDSKSLILLMAWLPTATSFAFLPFIRKHKATQQPNEAKVFYNFVYMSLGLAAFLLIIIIIQKSSVHFKQTAYYGSTAAMLFLLILPLGVVIVEEFKNCKIRKKDFNSGDPPQPLKILTEKYNQEKSETLPLAEQTVQEQVSCWQSLFKPPNRGEDYTIFQAIFSIDMLVLFLSTICGLGGTVTVVNNLGQIGTSLGYPAHRLTTFVSLTSIWIYFGKIVIGLASEVIITKFKFPRPLMLTSILILSCIGHLLIAFNVTNGLYAASIIIGFCFGANWPLLLTIISELFGLKYYSTLYTIGGMASPIGSYLLNVRLTGHLYDKEAKKQMAALGLTRKPGEELNCNGTECFKLSFIIITAVTIFGALVSLILVFRTRKFYRSDIYMKFKEEARTCDTEMGMTQKVGQSEARGG